MSRRRKPPNPSAAPPPKAVPEPSAVPARAPGTRASLGRLLALVAFGLLLPVVVLALVEGALALFGAGEEALLEDPFVGFAPGVPLYVERTLPDGSRVYETNPAKLDFFNEQVFPAEKAPGTYRVFAVGESTTFGHPYEDGMSFARWLERYARAADPSRTWEVVNAGGISYASYRMALLLGEIVRYEPDLILLQTGHNEFLEERTYGDLARQPEGLRRLRAWIGGFRFAALARRAFAGGTPEGRDTLDAEVETRLDVWRGLDAFHRDDAQRAAVVAHFAANLDRMIALARRHGAEVVLIAPVSNLKDFSPFKSEHRPGLAAAEAERFDGLLAQGRALLAQGRSEEALPMLEAARAIDPEYAEVHFRLGRAQLARGDYAAAEAAFVRAKNLDVAPLRALEPLVSAVRDAARRHGAPLVDLPELLAAESRRRLGHPILGDEVMLDHVHPDLPVHSLIAEKVLSLLIEKGIARPAPEWGEAARREVYDQAVAALDRRDLARRDLNLGKVLGWAGKLEEAEPPLLRAAEELDDEPDLHLTLGTLYLKTGRVAAALPELERAAALAPTLAPAQFNLGVALGRVGRASEAVAALEEAVRLRPGYPEALYNLERLRSAAAIERGVALAREGRLAEAQAALAAALAADPTSAEAAYNLGLVEARQGRLESAAQLYRQALAADPRHAPAHNNLAILAAGRGDLAEAARLLERAVEIDPSYGEAWLNLGVVYDQSRQPERATAAVERAVALDPDNAKARLALDLLDKAQGGSSR